MFIKFCVVCEKCSRDLKLKKKNFDWTQNFMELKTFDS